MFVMLALGALVLASIPDAQPAALRDDVNNQVPQNYGALLRNGVGTEVALPGPNATAEQVNLAARLVSEFIHKRSGLQLSTATLERLVAMELQVRRNGKLLPAGSFTAALSETLIVRIESLTNGEIEQATEVMRGFDAPDLSPVARAARRRVRLRANRLDALAPERFISVLRTWRDRTASENHDAILDRLRADLSKEVRSRLEDLASAVPEQWDAAPHHGLSPLQSLLIAYSIISDDSLWYSEGELKALLKSIEQIQTKRYGYYPPSEGRLAYGTNGYLFSSSLALVLDDQTINNLLDQLERMGTK
jgi:hypothetical protein